MDRRAAIAALVSLPEIARISVAPVKANDVIVVECDGNLSDDTAARLKATLEQVWPGRRCLVMDSGMKLKVVSQ